MGVDTVPWALYGLSPDLVERVAPGSVESNTQDEGRKFGSLVKGWSPFSVVTCKTRLRSSYELVKNAELSDERMDTFVERISRSNVRQVMGLEQARNARWAETNKDQKHVEVRSWEKTKMPRTQFDVGAASRRGGAGLVSRTMRALEKMAWSGLKRNSLKREGRQRP